MATEQVVATLERLDVESIKPARDGAVLHLGLRGDQVVAKLADTGKRIGDVRSAELIRHMRRGGEVTGRLEKSLSGAMVVCTLLPKHQRSGDARPPLPQSHE